MKYSVRVQGKVVNATLTFLPTTPSESEVIVTFSSSFSPYGDDDIKDDAILQLSSSSPV